MAECSDSLLRQATQRDYGTAGASSNDCRDGPRVGDTAVEKILTAAYDVQRNLLNGRPMYLNYSKGDFAGILLGVLGPFLLSSDVVDILFHEIDGAGKGLIDAEQIARYLSLLDDDTTVISNSYDFLSKSLPTFLFFCASSVSIANNLFRRAHGACALTTAALVVTMWLSFVASSMFVWEVLCSTFREKGLILLLRKNMTLRQIINFFWLLGSSSYVVAVHGSELFQFPDHIPPKLWVIGGASYFVGGLLSVPHIYGETLHRHEQNEEMMRKIRSCMDTSTSTPPDASTICNVEEDDVFSAISLKKTHIQETEQESRTLDTELMTQFSGSFGAEAIIGKDILPQDGSDSPIEVLRFDCQELYTSLEGPVDIDVFVHAVQAIVTEGTHNAVNFSRYATETRWISSHIKVIQKLTMLPSFYIAVMYAVAGGLFMLGAYEDEMPESTGVQNMFLAASSLYLCGSTYSLYQTWKATDSKWSLLRSCRVALRRKAFPMSEGIILTQPWGYPGKPYELV